MQRSRRAKVGAQQYQRRVVTSEHAHDDKEDAEDGEPEEAFEAHHLIGRGDASGATAVRVAHQRGALIAPPPRAVRQRWRSGVP